MTGEGVFAPVRVATHDTASTRHAVHPAAPHAALEAEVPGWGRREREMLRLWASSIAAISLLVICAYTTLKGRDQAGSGARLASDAELAGDFARHGMQAYGDSSGLGEMALGLPPAHVTSTLALGPERLGQLPGHSQNMPAELYEQELRRLHRRKPKPPCNQRPKPKGCARGRLQIDLIEPSVCGGAGGCVITFHGRNIVAGDNLEGNRANELMQVSLWNEASDQRVTGCTQINWIDKGQFDCTVEPGQGADLMWNVTIPEHDYAFKHHGTGYQWLGNYGYRGHGLPCEKNSCGYYFTFQSPTVNRIDPDVVEIGEETILKINGANFGAEPKEVGVLFNGKPCKQTQLADDNTLRCLISPIMKSGIVSLTVTIANQTKTVQVPVKDVPDNTNWVFTSDNTFLTEQWNITEAVIVDQSGLSKDWFQDHQAMILSSNPAQTIPVIMAETGLSEWEAVAVQLFRNYLKAHFDASAGHAAEDTDGVYISNLGNQLDGDPIHDGQVLEKQLQVMEAATGESRTELSHIVGNIVKTDPPCAGYPDCEPSDAVGHRGWTWHWKFDVKRETWAWEYGPISDGKKPPVSCGYCDPVKLHVLHTEDIVKEREQKCMYCVRENFKNLDSCQCADFKNMCLQTTETTSSETTGKVVLLSAAGDQTQPIGHQLANDFFDNLSGGALQGVVNGAELAFMQLGKRLKPAGKRLKPTAKQQTVPAEEKQEPVAASSPLVDTPYGETQCSFKPEADMCSHIGGVPSADGLACCPASCGSCGGTEECLMNTPGADVLSSECCQGPISSSGNFCTNSTPPCLMQADLQQVSLRTDSCEEFGGILDPASLQCCAASCGSCGGAGCEARPGGPANCCIDDVSSQNKMCSSSVHPPCTLRASGGPGTPIDGDSIDSVAEECRKLGGIPDPFSYACCPTTCNEGQPKCGGIGCGLREGGADACCSDNIAEANIQCSIDGTLPCIVAPQDVSIREQRAEECRSIGGVPDPSGFRCCPASCGKCGGADCDKRDGGESCCTDVIDAMGGLLAGNVICGAKLGFGKIVTPPCLTEFQDVASNMAALPIVSSEAQRVAEHGQSEIISGGLTVADSNVRVADRISSCSEMGGIPDDFGLTCCPSSCGKCGGEGCADREGGSNACCVDNVTSTNVECGSKKDDNSPPATPPCMLTAEIDPETTKAREETCAAVGGITDESGLRCCPATCGICGGESCAAPNCCLDSLDSAGAVCGSPPCLTESKGDVLAHKVQGRANKCAAMGGISDPFGLSCCSASCGTCGGTGCESRDSALPGSEKCCSDNLMAARVECGNPPCIWHVDASAAQARSLACAALGGVPDESGMRCCSGSCGTCGGDSCGLREGGATECCADDIDSSNVACGSPPCLMQTKEATEAAVQRHTAETHAGGCRARGGIPDPSGLKCCAASCGACGGEGCAKRPGGAEVCCGDEIGASNKTCGEPPCMFQLNPIQQEERSNACAAVGGVLDPTSFACCPTSCGTCGGFDCASRAGGANECCGDNIGEANKLCGHPPCLMSTWGATEGDVGSEWWRFNSGDASSWASRYYSPVAREEGTQARGRGIDSGYDLWTSGQLLLSPLALHDRDVDASVGQTIAEWSPEEYVSASNFPSSRLSGGVGAAGTSIRNPVVLICWALFLLICVGFIVHTLIYHREWFVPARLPEGEDEMVYPPSPRSIGSV